MNLLPRRVLAYVLDIGMLYLVLAAFATIAIELLGVRARSGAGVWLAAVLTFSVPAWAYFTLADASAGGATAGKRLLGIRVAAAAGGRVSAPRALARTAVKLLPWEMVHFLGFALSPVAGRMGPREIAGIAAGNLLALVYLGVAAATRGERAPHDFVARTRVQRAAAAAVAQRV